MIRHLPQRFAFTARLRFSAAAILAVCLVAAFVVTGGRAANPTSGTVTTANVPGNPLVFTGGPYTQPNPSGFVNLVCQAPALPCDDFALDVDVPAGSNDTKQVRILMRWPDPTADFDIRVYRRNADGTEGEEIKSIGSSSDPEIGVIPAVAGKYIVRVIPFAPLGQSVRVETTVEPKVARFNQGAGASPGYRNYAAPNGLGTDSGEPTLGVNWKTGRVMFIAGLQTLRVTFNDTASPATATWEDKSFLLTSLTTVDPILYTDNPTGRTIISQLAGTNSLSALTDDDGETWIPNEGGPLTSGVDHQTVGGGPFAPPLTGGTAAYPNAVYYCSQDLVTAVCARSDDGGLTYGPTVPMFALTCGGIHGHVQVAPDGTVYVPFRSCNSNQGSTVSTDNGITWQVRTVADGDDTNSTYDSIPGSWDPAIGIGARGTTYFGYDNGDGTPHITVSRDRGLTWTDDQNVGLPFNVRNTAFPTVVAGDDDRAAFAFLGTDKLKGDDSAVWHLYVATTYDGGKSWHTVDATPTDPVQLGTICDEGFGLDACSKGDRNLLDFMDIQVDKQGRVLVGYADGCVGCTGPTNSRSKLATIARQTCGRRLFAAFDSTAQACAPIGTGTPTPTPTPVQATEACDGANLVTDAAGDAKNPAPGGQGPTDQADITAISFEKSGNNLVTKMTLKNLSNVPSPGTTFTTYYVSWKGANGTVYATQADVDATGLVFYGYGPYDGSQISAYSTSTGTFTPGAGGTITVNVPLSAIGNPTIPVSPAGAAAVNEPAGTTIAGEGVLGAGLIFTTPFDRAAANARWSVCQSVATPTPTPTATATPTPTATPTATPTPSNDARCNGAGPEVVADAAGDQTGAPSANQSQDVRSVSISERYNAAGAGQLVFTMKVSDLTATLTPNASWRVSFNGTHADNTVTTYFVTVANNSTANPTGVSYNYGFVDTTRNNLNSTVGTADGGSMSADSDTLTIVLNMEKVKKPSAATTGQTLGGAAVPLGAGAQLTAVSGATSVLVGVVGNGLNVNVDSTSTGAYTLAGAATCPFVGPSPTPTPGGGGGGPVANAARFHAFAAPPGVAESAGEPTIGVNWRSERFFSNSAGAVPNGGTVNMFGGFLPYMLRVTFDDSVSPARVTWDQPNLVIANAPRVFGDPLLFTDSVTGRTFVSQELGLTPLGSTMEFTDDDGRTFTPSMGSGAPSGVDHQTVGGGPFRAPAPAGALYPSGVWYCSQSIADAVCAISLDGGITFGPSVPMYTVADCVGLHGHVKIAPDGTAYVPNKACGSPTTLHSGGKQSLIVSEDNGLSWKIRPIPTSTTRANSGTRDPSVAIAKDGAVYFGYQAADGRSHVAVSRNKGVTWESDTDVGALANVKNSAFHTAVAGDGDRAAISYFGTERDGTDWATPGFAGVWYLYVSTTYDGGRTWTTTNATPGDPVQRGGICGDGQCRNLLDFIGSTIDKQGRVVVGYDDGCIGGCVAGGANSFTAKASIARQSGGKRMFAAFDPPTASVAGAPAVAGNASGSTVNLSWATPDNGGSAVTGYKVYRRDANGVTLLATVAGTSYADAGYADGAAYRVTATNGAGEGPYKEFSPSTGPVASPCDGAGLLVTSDVSADGADIDSGQNTPPDARVNIKSLHVGEPFMGAGANKLVFTLKVGASTVGSAAPPSSQWYVIWNSRQPTFDFDRRYVAMISDAAGNVRFEYGKFGAATNTSTSTLPPPNSTFTNQPVKVGDAQGNYDAANGTITITLPTSNAEGVAAGQTMDGLNARTFFARPEAGVRNQAVANDITGNGSYTLVGNDACSGAGGQSASAQTTMTRTELALAVVRRVFGV